MEKENEYFSDEGDEYPSEEENIYSNDGRERLLEDDELSPQEAAFMQGYEEALEI